MKKILTLLITILLCLSLIGCDNKSNEETIKEEETTTQEVVIDNTKQEETTVEEQKEEPTEEETTIIEEQKESTNTTINAKSYVLHVGIAEGVTLIIKRISSKVGAELGRIYPETSKLYEGDVIEISVSTSNSLDPVYAVADATLLTNNQYTINTSDVTITTGYKNNGSNSSSSSSSNEPNYLTFTAKADNSSITPKFASGSYQFLTSDASEWVDGYNDGTTTITLTSVGDKVMLKGTNCTTNETNYFSMTGSISASGDVTSLTNGFGGNATLTNACYQGMFNGCTSLTTAPNLPSTALAVSCYAGMFADCTSLTVVPTLPATNLTNCNYCYVQMFNGCISLATAPVLPATTLAEGCYNCMFYGCSALTTAPALPATKLAVSCYSGMFQNCSSLTATPALPATNLTNCDNCYSQMFAGCSSLESAPVLPATTLANGCYNSMFYGCSSLNIDISGEDANKIFTCPDLKDLTDPVKDMFKGTGGTFKGTPEKDNTYYWHQPACFAKGTKIKMYDNTIKNIEDVNVGDKVLTFNHEKSIYEAQDVYYAFKGENKAKAFTLHFDNGNSLSIVGEHDLFEKEDLKYVTIRQSDAELFIGKHFYNVTDEKYVKLTNVTYETELIDFYTIYTSCNANCVANDMLSVPKETEDTLNIYEFNNDLTIDNVQLQKDIAQYGIFEYPEDATYTKEYYDATQLKYANIMVGKGLVTWDILWERIGWGLDLDN